MVNKVVEPKWCDGDILPTHLADILDKAIETKNEHRLVDESIDEISIKVMKNLNLKQTIIVTKNKIKAHKKFA